MTWRYQATHHTVNLTDDVFEVREVFGPDDDGGLSWTTHAIVPDSETKEGLIDVLQLMLKDVQELDVLEVDE